MDKSQNYFDPYNFNMQPTIQHQNGIQPEIVPGVETPMNPSMYYEQQYMYYRYLSQMMDYKIKQKEFDRLNNNNSK